MPLRNQWMTQFPNVTGNTGHSQDSHPILAPWLAVWSHWPMTSVPSLGTRVLLKSTWATPWLRWRTMSWWLRAGNLRGWLALARHVCSGTSAARCCTTPSMFLLIELTWGGVRSCWKGPWSRTGLTDWWISFFRRSPQQIQQARWSICRALRTGTDQLVLASRCFICWGAAGTWLSWFTGIVPIGRRWHAVGRMVCWHS